MIRCARRRLRWARRLPPPHQDPALQVDDSCMLVIRGAGPVAYPGSAEVVNMTPPDYLVKQERACCPVWETVDRVELPTVRRF